MSLLVYAICRTGSVDPDALPAGCAGAPVHAICTERLTALFSDGYTHKAQADSADFDAFDRVIESAHAMGVTLPVRFGTVFEDDAKLSRSLRHRTSALTEELERIDDTVEMTITLHKAARVVTRSARVASGVPAMAMTDGTGALSVSEPVRHATGPNGGGRGGPSLHRPDASRDLSLCCRMALSDLRPFTEEFHFEDAGAIRDAGVMRCRVKLALAPIFSTVFEDLREELGFEGRLSTPSPCYSFATQTLA